MKNNFKIYDECGCEVWAKALVRDLFTRAGIKAEKVIIYDMDDRRICMRAEVWDETLEPDEVGGEPGGWEDKHYTIRYFEDGKFFGRLSLSFKFYGDERVIVEGRKPDGGICRYDAPRYLDMGSYKIISWLGKAKCIRQKN